MSPATPLPFAVGDLLLLRRPHPCGGREWRVDRIGADIGIVCGGCGHRVLVERVRLERRLERRIPAGGAA